MKTFTKRIIQELLIVEHPEAFKYLVKLLYPSICRPLKENKIKNLIEEMNLLNVLKIEEYIKEEEENENIEKDKETKKNIQKNNKFKFDNDCSFNNKYLNKYTQNFERQKNSFPQNRYSINHLPPNLSNNKIVIPHNNSFMSSQMIPKNVNFIQNQESVNEKNQIEYLKKKIDSLEQEIVFIKKQQQINMRQYVDARKNYYAQNLYYSGGFQQPNTGTVNQRFNNSYQHHSYNNNNNSSFGYFNK